VIAVPTTAGTGSEVTRNAVLGSKEHGVKASLRSPHMLPRVAIIDPDLTLDLPPAITASTGMDALTQLIEPFVSVRANPMTDMFCLEGIQRVARSLRRAFQDGHDREARTDMAFAALLGGLALANAGLGVVHGFAAPIGGMYDAPHGAVCAALLPHGMAANLNARRDRFTNIARLLTRRDNATAEEGVDWVRKLSAELAIPSLSTYGVTDSGDLVSKAAQASSMKANPVSLSYEELHQVLRAAL
jgi:alcohol dehydrogenase class IV